MCVCVCVCVVSIYIFSIQLHSVHPSLNACFHLNSKKKVMKQNINESFIVSFMGTYLIKSPKAGYKPE